MLKIYFLVALAGLSLMKHASWKAKSLDNAEALKAVCSDGSTPRYFKSLSQKDSSLWVLYLLGGAGCSNEAMCLDRLKTKSYYTSTKGFSGEFSHSEGIFERDCELNPHFCEANYVVVSYCSSDWWSGDNTYYFENSKEPALIHFRGFNIVEAVIAQLLKDTPLSKAQSFVFGGTSAGGVGVMNLADHVHSTLKAKAKSLVKFNAIIDSALFLGNPMYKPLPCKDSFYCGVEKTYREGVKIWKNKFDKDCAAALGDQAWKCFMVEQGVGFVQAPTLIHAFKYDIWQWMSNGGQMEPGALGFLASRGHEVADIAKKLLKEKKIEYAVISSCFYHGAMHYKEEFLEFKIDEKTTAEAVHQFVTGKQGSLINECEGFGCNEECTPLERFGPKEFASTPDFNWPNVK